MSTVVALLAVVATYGSIAAAASSYRPLPDPAPVRVVVRRAWWSVPAVVTVAVGLVVRACGVPVPFPTASWVATLLGAGTVVLGVVAGGPVADVVLRLTDRPAASSAGDSGALRGGATIGVLERAVVVVGVAVGSWEVVAGVIAVKGLGRFGDLATGRAREQFIIGTLVSLLWAGTCAGLVWFHR